MTFDDLVRTAHADTGQLHVFDKALSETELDEWLQCWPNHRLPDDLVALLRRANGIHLCADPSTRRAYEGLSPLSEWKLARNAMWGEDADPKLLGDEFLALSYHTDGSAYTVLDVRRGKYFLMDSCGADETCPIGSSVSELLDWLWTHRVG